MAKFGEQVKNEGISHLHSVVNPLEIKAIKQSKKERKENPGVALKSWLDSRESL